ncbi:lytic transglycosylase domain-containing protein [Phyllobacterium brassicacearum]|nr:lytic transglycosylase domain-containing protein [Phyllobacterium brassicacearum]TDQ18181.1 transglycosylase-like protein with SLT domain [Phyllobacterium brassicacearum]
MKGLVFVSSATVIWLCSAALAEPKPGFADSGPVEVTAVEKQPDDRITQRVIEASTLEASTAPRRRTDGFKPASLMGIQSDNIPSQPSKSASQHCIDNEFNIRAVKGMIEAEAARQGADAKLALAIADQESGFGASVNSNAGARGIMQLMPATAAQYGVTDICDAAQNIRGGIAFLKDLDVTFGGNIMLMVAAYNSGEDRVLKSGGIPSISETVNYTARVTNAYYGFNNTLKGGKRTKSNAVAGNTEQQSSGVNELPVQTVGDGSPIPINQPESRTEGGRQQWIGGSVLYVQ